MQVLYMHFSIKGIYLEYKNLVILSLEPSLACGIVGQGAGGAEHPGATLGGGDDTTSDQNS